MLKTFGDKKCCRAITKKCIFFPQKSLELTDSCMHVFSFKCLFLSAIFHDYTVKGQVIFFFFLYSFNLQRNILCPHMLRRQEKYFNCFREAVNFISGNNHISKQIYHFTFNDTKVQGRIDVSSLGYSQCLLVGSTKLRQVSY